MTDDPDNLARGIAVAAFALSAISLYLARRDAARRGTHTTSTLRVDAMGFWRAVVRNPTDLDISVKVSLVGTRSTGHMLMSRLLGWLHPTVAAEWRYLSEVVSSYGGMIPDLGGPKKADDWITIPAKQHVELMFSLKDWRPKYLALLVKNGLETLDRGRFVRYQPGRSAS